MLQAMQQAAETRTLSERGSTSIWDIEPSPISSSFAGILAALTSPAKKHARTSDNDDLADDIATLSYESALKTHARYRGTDQSLTESAKPAPVRMNELGQATLAEAAKPAARHFEDPSAISDVKANSVGTTPIERNLKDASITIRMSKAECAQLHQRAAEAGLTISAYLRSCTFEAESLRAMVKDTLAQLRSATTQAKPAALNDSLIGGWARWMARLLPRWSDSQRVARA